MMVNKPIFTGCRWLRFACYRTLFWGGFTFAGWIPIKNGSKWKALLFPMDPISFKQTSERNPSNFQFGNHQGCHFHCLKQNIKGHHVDEPMNLMCHSQSWISKSVDSWLWASSPDWKHQPARDLAIYRNTRFLPPFTMYIIYTYIHIHIWICVYVCMGLYVYIHVNMYIDIYIYTYIYLIT